VTGDAIHFKGNWDNKRMASMSASAEQRPSSGSTHDKPQSQTQKHSPQFDG
jgi:hypothetical protein